MKNILSTHIKSWIIVILWKFVFEYNREFLLIGREIMKALGWAERLLLWLKIKCNQKIIDRWVNSEVRSVWAQNPILSLSKSLIKK